MQKDAILELITYSPNVVIGGSFSLKFFSLISREPSDIDIIIPKLDTLSHHNLTDYCMEYYLQNPNNEVPLSDTTDDENGVLIERKRLIINEINCCLFKRDLDKSDIIRTKFNDKNINLLAPGIIIKAKHAYSLKNTKSKDKHFNDLARIKKFLDIVW